MTLSTHRSGFTMIEILMAISVIAILAVASSEIFTRVLDEGRYEETISRMNAIRDAMGGNPEIKEAGVRTQFGFIGDIGTIPTAVQGIVSLATNNGPWPAYAIDATTRIGVGWNGPYLIGKNTPDEYTYDGWGNVFQYSAADFTVTSYGADGAAGGTGYDADIVVKLMEWITTTVDGFAHRDGIPLSGEPTEMELAYPVDGVVYQDLQSVTLATGQITFNGVPPGVHSLMIYQPDKATATTTIGPIFFTVDRANYIIPTEHLNLSP